MPWLPELFSAPTLARIEARRTRRRHEKIAFFDGVMTGEVDALVASFAGPPELHQPLRGRVKGEPEFRRFVSEVKIWMEDHDVLVEDVGVIVTPIRSVEEVVLRAAVRGSLVELPVAIVNDRQPDERIVEQRIYVNARALGGFHAMRPPLLQPGAVAAQAGVIGDLQQALAAGDAQAAMAAFEPAGVVREPAGAAVLHRGAAELRAFFELLLGDGGITLEHCAATDDGHACALEYNVVGWGRIALPPQAGVAVHVRGDGGRLAAARIYGDVSRDRRTSPEPLSTGRDSSTLAPAVQRADYGVHGRERNGFARPPC